MRVDDQSNDEVDGALGKDRRLDREKESEWLAGWGSLVLISTVRILVPPLDSRG